jgi:hypothetical protein
MYAWRSIVNINSVNSGVKPNPLSSPFTTVTGQKEPGLILSTTIQTAKPTPLILQQHPWIPYFSYNPLVEHYHSIKIKQAINPMCNHDNSMLAEFFSDEVLHLGIGFGVHAISHQFSFFPSLPLKVGKHTC